MRLERGVSSSGRNRSIDTQGDSPQSTVAIRRGPDALSLMYAVTPADPDGAAVSLLISRARIARTRSISIERPERFSMEIAMGGAIRSVTAIFLASRSAASSTDCAHTGIANRTPTDNQTTRSLYGLYSVALAMFTAVSTGMLSGGVPNRSAVSSVRSASMSTASPASTNSNNSSTSAFRIRMQP